MDDTAQVEELTTAECWELLAADSLGRLAFRVADEIHIRPVNYVARGGALFFLSAEGTKLLAVVMESPVALEIDSYDDEVARSVVVRGTARLLPEDEAHVADDLEQLPWVLPDTPKYNVVRIDPVEIAGRLFRRA